MDNYVREKVLQNYYIKKILLNQIVQIYPRQYMR